MQRFYVYVIAYFLLPVFISIATFFFWLLRYLNDARKMCVRIIQTLLIVFFLIHPSITQIFLQSFE